MSKNSMQQKIPKEEERKIKISKLINLSKATFNKTYLKTKDEGIPVKINKEQFIAGLIVTEGISKQMVNILMTDLIREKIISIEKTRDINSQKYVDAIIYYPPQEIIDGKKEKIVGLSEAEINEILSRKPIQSFPNITICKSCNCLTHNKKGQEGICAKCGKSRKGEIIK
jgi:hypothetical protein